MDRISDADRSQWLWMLFQFTVSGVVGCWIFWWFHQDSNPEMAKSGTLAGFIGGLIAARAAMFLITWARFGWRAARSMRMY